MAEHKRHYGENVPVPPEEWSTVIADDAVIKTWHVYQQKNGLWTVTAEDEDGNLAIKAFNVPTEPEAIHHEAQRMAEKHGGEVVAEMPRFPQPDPEHIEEYDFEPPRRAGE